jgi:NADH:ubiquinone oxidoreductase subunit 5 (subunit L)/multisubunit Na+/H+ antiporter MnhA subunit
LGILLALSQHDLKRLLAYSSVENIGIITIGLGLSILGMSCGQPALIVLGMAGALIHVVNHALFKGLLFLAAGSILHAVKTREMDQLGGLLKKMPLTGICFFAGATAICGLPVFNGFIGEFHILLGAFQGIIKPETEIVAPTLAILSGIGLIGGLAAVCFTRTFGMVFLGEPRSSAVNHAHEGESSMTFPLFILAFCCLVIGIGSPWFIPAVFHPISCIVHLPSNLIQEQLTQSASYCFYISMAALIFAVIAGGLALLRRHQLSKHPAASVGTWDCGYARPTAHMQYTGSSYVQPLMHLFKPILGTRIKTSLPEGLFPAKAGLTTETPDFCHGNIYHPAFVKICWGLSKLRWLQHGNVQLYVLYIALTLMILFLWGL